MFCAFACLIIKKHNPELSLALSTLASASVLIFTFASFAGVTDLLELARTMLGGTSELFKPMIKCMCIGFISKFGSDICKDAAQTSLASAIELGGTLCAAGTAMPLIISTLKLIGTMV